MNRTRQYAALLISVVLFAGCGESPDKVSRLTSPSAPVVTVPRRQVRPAVSLDSLSYEVFSGTLSPGQSGVLSRSMHTWGSNCLFSLTVPATSMPDQGAPINFTMSIPTKSSYLAHPELDSLLIIRFAPDGQHFPGPITIQGTWMPWQGVPPAQIWFYSGADSGLATVTYVPSINRYRIQFDVTHFSDWEVGPTPRRTGP